VSARGNKVIDMPSAVLKNRGPVTDDVIAFMA
jgi:hypothetical protein